MKLLLIRHKITGFVTKVKKEHIYWVLKDQGFLEIGKNFFENRDYYAIIKYNDLRR